MLNLDCWRTSNCVFPKVKDLSVVDGLNRGKKIARNQEHFPMTASGLALKEKW